MRGCLKLHFEFSSHGFLLSLRNKSECKLKYLFVIFMASSIRIAMYWCTFFSSEFLVSSLLSIYTFKHPLFYPGRIFLEIILVHKKYSVILLNKWISTTAIVMCWFRWENDSVLTRNLMNKLVINEI